MTSDAAGVSVDSRANRLRKPLRSASNGVAVVGTVVLRKMDAVEGGRPTEATIRLPTATQAAANRARLIMGNPPWVPDRVGYARTATAARRRAALPMRSAFGCPRRWFERLPTRSRALADVLDAA
jgi:hypothetical protein